MFVAQRRLGNTDRQWKRYSEVVTRVKGRGRYTIFLREEPRGFSPRGLGQISTGSIVATGASVGGSAVASAAGLGAAAGPIGAGIGALVGIIASLWAAHDARVKGATEENEIVGSALSTWDAGMQQIFAAANSGQITGQQGAQLVSQLMASYWSAVAQAKGLPGVADSSNSGGNCGSYTPGQTTRCTPSGAPKCNKQCTVGCCVGCNDLYPSSLDAIAVLMSASGGSFTTCTVYSSSFGLAQRNGYQLSYTPPAPTAANAATEAGSAIAGAVGLSPTDTVAGIPVSLLALGAAGLLIFSII